MRDAFYIVDVRKDFRGNPYITLWRPNDANPGYYHKHRYGTAPAFDRFPVPCDLVQRFGTDPAPGRIDGDAGPVIPNTAAVRAALRRARYVPAGLRHLKPSKEGPMP